MARDRRDKNWYKAKKGDNYLKVALGDMDYAQRLMKLNQGRPLKPGGAYKKPVVDKRDKRNRRKRQANWTPTMPNWTPQANWTPTMPQANWSPHMPPKLKSMQKKPAGYSPPLGMYGSNEYLAQQGVDIGQNPYAIYVPPDIVEHYRSQTLDILNKGELPNYVPGYTVREIGLDNSPLAQYYQQGSNGAYYLKDTYTNDQVAQTGGGGGAGYGGYGGGGGGGYGGGGGGGYSGFGYTGPATSYAKARGLTPTGRYAPAYTGLVSWRI